MIEISHYINKCRFCYKDLLNKDGIAIDNEMLLNYYFVMNKELIISPKLSSFSCKDCRENFRMFCHFKRDVTIKQEKLYKLLSDDEMTVKEEQKIESEGVLMDENIETCQEYIEEIDENQIISELDINRTDPIKTKTNIQNTTFDCKMCNKSFINTKKLKIHESRAHKNLHKCEYCDFKAVNKSELLKHVKAAHIKKDNTTDLRICPDCGKILKGNNHLNFHIKTKHLKLTKFQCDLCSFKSYGKYEIRSHILIHHLPLELRKEFKCDMCPSVLTTAMSLKTHKRHKHSGLRPFQCVFCYKNYALKETLKSHIRNVHNGERKYKCPHCNKGYNSNNRLTDHINNTHGEKQEIPCDKCGKIFASLRNLQTHSVYHSNPTLKCGYCDKLFYIKKNLREHQESVHLGVTYQCEICQKKFQSTSGLRRHAKSHTK